VQGLGVAAREFEGAAEGVADGEAKERTAGAVEDRGREVSGDGQRQRSFV